MGLRKSDYVLDAQTYTDARLIRAARRCESLARAIQKGRLSPEADASFRIGLENWAERVHAWRKKIPAVLDSGISERNQKALKRLFDIKEALELDKANLDAAEAVYKAAMTDEEDGGDEMDKHERRARRMVRQAAIVARSKAHRRLAVTEILANARG